MKTVMALVALAGLAAFLGVMVWHVPSPDLVIVILLTFCAAAFDLFRSIRNRSQ